MFLILTGNVLTKTSFGGADNIFSIAKDFGFLNQRFFSRKVKKTDEN